MLTTQTSVSAAAALRLVEAALGEAGRHGWSVAVAVVDRSGLPLATARMDAVTPPVIEFALDKAYTAATMRRSTEAFFGRMTSSPSLALGFQNRQRLMVWGGGLPIVADGQVVGGIGVSGAQDFEDVACARAALESVGLAAEG